MPLELFMIVLIPNDLAKTVAFYRTLGLDIPTDTPGPRVEIRMTAGLSLLFIGKGRVPELDDTRVAFEYYLKERSALERKYAELAELGYESHHAPFIAPIGMVFATIKDPDGNVILLSADP